MHSVYTRPLPIFLSVAHHTSDAPSQSFNIVYCTACNTGVGLGIIRTHTSKLCFIADITIGFDPATYEVNENGGTVTLTVKVLTGTISEGRDILIRVNTVGDSALGKKHSRIGGT